MNSSEKFETERVRRRKQLEIIEEVLSVCRTPATRTRIMYRVNLNFSRVTEYIKFLHKLGLIEEKSGGNLKTYQITKRGEELLLKLQEVKEF